MSMLYFTSNIKYATRMQTPTNESCDLAQITLSVVRAILSMHKHYGWIRQYCWDHVRRHKLSSYWRKMGNSSNRKSSLSFHDYEIILGDL